VHCRDARAGLAEWGECDRLIAWASSPHLPGAWLAAVREDGVPHVERLLRGGFVPLHGPTVPGVPDLASEADVAWSASEDAPWTTITWLSARWLRPRSPANKATLRRLLHSLAPATPLVLDEDAAAAFALFVLVTRHDAVVAQLPTVGRAIGVGSRDGLALLALEPNVLLSTSEDAADRLRAVARSWQAAGRPDLADYTPQLRRTGPDWLVRLRLRLATGVVVPRARV
jgi:hypothetical protein